MYFAKPDFHTGGDIAAQAAASAAQARRQAAEWHIPLDGNEGDLAKLDALFVELRDRKLDKTLRAFVAQIFSAYIGELACRHLGGVWGYLRVYTDLVPAIRVGTNEIVWTIHPHISDLLDRGNRPTLAHYYAGLKKTMNGPTAGRWHKETRRYKIRPDNGYYFRAGTICGNQSILLGVLYSGLVILFFDESGVYTRFEQRPLPFPMPRNKLNSPYMSSEARAACDESLDAWTAELGYIACPITIHKFHVDEFGFGIEDYPSHMESFLQAPFCDTQEEQEEMKQSIAAWESEGSFVLYWGNDIWLNGEGEITST